MLTLGGVLVVGWGQLALYRREADIARIHCEEAVALSEENAIAEWIPWGRFIRGWAIFQLGQVNEGLAEMDAGILGFRQLGGVPRLQYLLAVRAETISRLGRVEDALTIINEALNHIARSGEDAERSEILRLKGEVLLMRNPAGKAEAETCFREAPKVSGAQEAKWWELRTTVSLARLLRDTNRRDRARTILAEIYNWFTEGFDLPDLREARTLLDELSS
jgi:predicted ATPase